MSNTSKNTEASLENEVTIKFEITYMARNVESYVIQYVENLSFLLLLIAKPKQFRSFFQSLYEYHEEMCSNTG